MKKLLSLVLALMMVVSLFGCDYDNSDRDDDEAEEYIEEAEELIEEGDYEGAIEVLREGLEETNSEEIEEMLENLDIITVPNIVGKYIDALPASDDYVIQESINRQYSTEFEAGQIIRQDPVSGSKVVRGTKITAFVSKGAPEEVVEPFIPTEPSEPIDATEAPSESTIICVFYYNGATTFARLEDLSNPDKYLESEAEVQRIYGNNYVQWEYRNEYGDNIVYGDNVIQKRINLFLSNFAEIHCKAYPTTDYQKLNFVILHSKVNNRSIVKNDENNYFISKTDVNNTLKNFLGKSVNPSEGQEFRHPTSTSPYDVITYRNGNFYYPLADGVLTDYVAVATFMHKNPDGTYYVEYDVYYVPMGNLDDYYGIDAEGAENDGNISFEYSACAIVKDYTRDNGKQSYQLVDLY